MKNTGNVMHELVIGARRNSIDETLRSLRWGFPNMEHDEALWRTSRRSKTGEIVWTFNKAGTLTPV